jgi:RimJ/RimL family protein N-acetyltransferase
MQLRNLGADDLWIYEAQNAPEMMEHLGGPRSAEGMADKFRRDVAATEADEYWVLVIVPDDDPSTAAGTVAVWSHEEHEEPINEIGWMVLPRYQGRGIGTTAVGAALDRARATGRWDVVHAFPSVTNAASNAICRKLGFEKMGEQDFPLPWAPDKILRCNHWRLDLRRA